MSGVKNTIRESSYFNDEEIPDHLSTCFQSLGRRSRISAPSITRHPNFRERFVPQRLIIMCAAAEKVTNHGPYLISCALPTY
jgi:hypothetical protein